MAAPAFAQTPLSADDFLPADPAQAQIGQLLFYDKVLSGNRNISCGTCHHHDHAGTDGLSLGIGEGGTGVGPKRTIGQGKDLIRKRIPRNAPALWNIGHRDVKVLFQDGRLSVSDLYGNSFNSPAEEWLPSDLDNIVAAQARFPMTAQFEMAGNLGENDITHATQIRIDRAWPLIAERVAAIPEYVDMFTQAFEDVSSPRDITIVHIGNALGAFIISEWTSTDTLYDQHLRRGTPLPPPAAAGKELFSVMLAARHATLALSFQTVRSVPLACPLLGLAVPVDLTPSPAMWAEWAKATALTMPTGSKRPLCAMSR